MMIRPVLNRLVLVLVTTLLLTTLAQQGMAQTDSVRRQQAVRLLVKETAQQVFAQLGKEPKGAVAKHIADSLSHCPAGCDPFAVIDNIDRTKGWQKVRERLANLQQQANSPQLLALTGAPLAEQLGLVLNQFTELSGKDNVAYKKALTSANQKAIMAGVSPLLTGVPAVPAVVNDSTTTETADLPEPPSALNSLSYTSLLMGFLLGLALGAVGVYFLLYRQKQAEATRLRDERNDLRENLRKAQVQPNRSNGPTPEIEMKARKYDQLLSISNGADPFTLLMATKPAQQPPIVEKSSPAPTQQVPLASEKPTLVVTPNSQPPVVVPPTLAVVETSAVTSAPAAVFYLPPPSDEGVFDAGQSSPVPTSTTAYKFSTSTKKPGEATFRFEAQQNRVERLITYQHFYIKPVCESIDEVLPGQTSIVNVTDGVAMLENGQWRVTKKALIKYQ